MNGGMKTGQQFWVMSAGRVVATSGLVLCLVGCKGKPQAALPQPPMVEVETVTQADVPIYHEWIGVLDGLVNAQIRAQVTGYLLTQNYREGDPIKKVELLFEIDSRPFKAVLDQAKGTVVIGGMFAATCIAVCLIPVTFYVVEKLARSRRGLKPETDVTPTGEAPAEGTV